MTRRGLKNERLRRRSSESGGQQPLYRCGGENGLVVDYVHRQVRSGGSDVHLTPTEYDLLCELPAMREKCSRIENYCGASGDPIIAPKTRMYAPSCAICAASSNLIPPNPNSCATNSALATTSHPPTAKKACYKIVLPPLGKQRIRYVTCYSAVVRLKVRTDANASPMREQVCSKT